MRSPGAVWGHCRASRLWDDPTQHIQVGRHWTYIQTVVGSHARNRWAAVLYQAKGDEMQLAAAEPLPADTLEADLLAAYPGLVRRLALVLRDDMEAEDVAQSAFARAIQARGRFRGGDARAWLFTIGLRLAFNELRRRRRARADSRDAVPTWAIRSDPDLWSALAELEPQPRAALLLSVLDGYTHDEIAAMLDVRPGTVSSWLSRTKERLRVALRED
jgi:RNA polymerase sigma-70 factor (ECF subfamily)